MARTADSMALDILLAPISEKARARQLTALLSLANGECPVCGNKDTEDNGASGSQFVNLCTCCGHQWGPGTEV